MPKMYYVIYKQPFTWCHRTALLRRSVWSVNEILLDQGRDVIRVQDGQVVEAEGHGTNGLEVGLYGVVQQVHHLVSWSEKVAAFCC